MIWVRRAFAAPLTLLLIVVLFVVVTVTQVNDTVVNPKFYNDRMTEADVYNFVYDDVVPAALDEVEDGGSMDMPIDLSDIESEIILIVKTIFPPVWMQAQFESLTGTLIPYFVGDSDHFTFTLWLKDRLGLAGDAIKAEILYGDAFTDVYNDLISYAAAELHDSLDELPPSVTITEPMLEDSLRSVVPEGWLAAQIASAMDSLIAYVTKDASHFTISLPFAELYTDADLLLLLGAGNEAYLDEAWDWIEGELTFTDADLMNELDADDEETLQDVRNWIATGYTVTEADLREAMADDGNIEGFDSARRWIHTGRSLLWLMWILPVVLIAGIGFLGGRSWKGRIAWALGTFLFAAVVVLVVTMLLYSNVGKPRIVELMFDVNSYQGVAQVLAGKGNELIQNSIDSFIDGMRMKTVYVIIASGVGLMGVAAWYLVDLSRRRSGRRPVGPMDVSQLSS